MDTKGELKSLTVVESQISEGNDFSLQPGEESSLSLEDSFSSRDKYAGSFRLRFAAGDSRNAREKRSTAIEYTETQPNSSSTAVFSSLGFIEEKPDAEDPKSGFESQTPEAETQQLSLKFIAEDSEDIGQGELDSKTLSDDHSNPPPQLNEEQTLQSRECGNLPELEVYQSNADGTRTSISQNEGHRITVNGQIDQDSTRSENNQKLTDVVSEEPTQTQSQEVNQTEASSITSNADESDQIQEENDDTFHFFPPEEEPVLNPNFEKRAMRAMEFVISDEIVDKHTNTCEKCCTNCCDFEIRLRKTPLASQLSPEIKNASNQGFSMLRKVFFPAMPKFLTDILVSVELGVTVTQFVLSLITVSIENNRGYNITYIVLAGIALLLALIDAFLYFVQLGSCARIFHYCYSKHKKNLGRKIDVNDEDRIQEKHKMKCCQLLGPKVKGFLAQSFELLRTVLSEFLIYPLVVLDLFDLIVGGTYLRQTSADRINFSLFIIGSTFLVLSVYFTRTFMVISAAVNIRRTPLDPSNSKSSMINLVTQFCVHVIFQIIVHIAVIVIVGVKIHQENPNPCSDFQSSCTFVSPFLIYTIIAGGILPLYGIGIFFIIKYYNLRELSIGFWVNMLALLQSESFATALFSNKGIKESKQRAKHVIEKIKYEEVKHQLKSFESTPTWTKLLYPLRFPIFVAIAALYEFLLLSFIGCLAFSIDTNGQVQFVLFDQGLSSAAVIVTVLIFVANLHVLTLISLWILAVLAFLILLLLQPVFWIIVTILYVPSVTIFGFVYCLVYEVDIVHKK